MLVGARLAQGLGAAFTLPAALSILTTSFKEGKDRNTAIGVWGGIAGIASAVGVLLGGLFTSVLSLCARAGMVKVGTIAVDGTKVHANASADANADYERIAREILKEAAEVDAAEDELYGEKRGDELPEHLSTSQGRRGWLREAKRQLDEERAKEARPVPRSRPARLKEAKRRLEEELWVESRANAAYESYRVHGRASDGKRLGAAPTPYTPPEVPHGKMNLTDPDSRMLKASRGYLQGYNVQAAVDENQVVIAAEVTVDSPDFGHLEPIVNAAQSDRGRRCE